ncbi:hypothetical protein WR25_06754 [Diploscapter pachys]|uniref:Histone H2B n=1 Tax=Diploscapter pachys TaxID=2018661 RepID=A0A2A2KA60_9BILA|nr:hypothetical protein WR25_06754 [Diploscapter pachys]
MNLQTATRILLPGELSKHAVSEGTATISRSSQRGNLVAFASDPSGELDVLGHDGDSLGVDGAQIGVLEQAGQVGFGSLLQGEHCRRLEAEVRLEVLRDLTD